MAKNSGFLTVLDHQRYGLVGGYLVLNPVGRPLEFHCTAPVRANKAQEILYGTTLKPYLYGEQIARKLIDRAKAEIAFVFTDMAPVLAVQEVVDSPVFYVFNPNLNKQDHFQEKEQSDSEQGESEQTGLKQDTIEISPQLNETIASFGIENERLRTVSNQDDPLPRIPQVSGLNTQRWQETRLGNRTIALPSEDQAQCSAWLEEIKEISYSIDLAEPFTRIRLAIEEAQRAA